MEKLSDELVHDHSLREKKKISSSNGGSDFLSDPGDMFKFSSGDDEDDNFGAAKREAAAEILDLLWNNPSFNGFTKLELNMDTIRQRLMNDTPIDLCQPNVETIPVPLQRKYTGRKPVLPSALADTLCSEFTPKLLLLLINSLLYTTYSLSVPLSSLFQSYIDKPGTDFGTLYAHVRSHWIEQDFANFEEKRLQAAEEMERCRHSMLTGNMIKNPQIPPRRLWDLFANRVIESSLISSHWSERMIMLPCGPGSYLYCLQPEQMVSIYAVSHSWASLHERDNVSTAINAHEWRVPIPNDITLDRVRVELLNFGAEYAWLDVLCLRQADSSAKGEEYRKEEWALDVPTIGNVYRDSEHIIHYFSGLGRPFVIGDLGSNRHWLNRAWTLQEIGAEGSQTTAGITEASPADPWKDSGVGPFYDAIASARDIMDGRWSPTKEPQTMQSALLSMRGRQCENALDRIAGLAYAIGCITLPVYDTSWSVEQAWEAHIGGLGSASVIILSMIFSAPGDGRYRFLPSWGQIMQADSPNWGLVRRRSMSSDLMFSDNEWLHLREDNQHQLLKDAHLIPQCRVEGLGEGEAGVVRRGRAIMHYRKGGTMERPCASTIPIVDGSYALLAFANFHLLGPAWAGDEAPEPEDSRNLMWMVGHTKDNQFHKEATLELCNMVVPEGWEAVGESAEGLVLV